MSKNTAGSNRSHPLESRAIRFYLWLMLGAVFIVQAFGVWGLCVRGQQLCDFGRFYYAVAAWSTRGADLFQPNFATPKVIDGQTFEMQNVASPGVAPGGLAVDVPLASGRIHALGGV